MAVAAGTRFGRYEIRSLIRTGGMGEVYLAQDTQLRRPVAIKVLTGEFTQDAARLRRFEHESYAASSLNHPNILTIHEIGSQEGLHYIATEYIDGESLRDRLHHSRMQLHEFSCVPAGSPWPGTRCSADGRREQKPKGISRFSRSLERC